MSGAPLLRMEPEALRSSAKKMDHVSEDLQQVLDALRTALEAEGDCWGHDEAGQSFAQNYIVNRDKLQDAMGKTSKAIGDISANLTSTANDTESHDEQIGDGLSDLQRQI